MRDAHLGLVARAHELRRRAAELGGVDGQRDDLGPAASAHAQADADADEQQQRGGRRGERRADPQTAEAGAQAVGERRRLAAPALPRLGLHDRHQPALELGSRLGGRHRKRQDVGGDAQALDLVAAGRADVEVGGEAPRLVLVERAEHPRAGGVAQGVVVTHGAASAGPSCERIFASPRRMRPLTVPTGVSSIEAISDWLKPPK